MLPALFIYAQHVTQYGKIGGGKWKATATGDAYLSLYKIPFLSVRPQDQPEEIFSPPLIP